MLPDLMDNDAILGQRNRNKGNLTLAKQCELYGKVWASFVAKSLLLMIDSKKKQT